MDKNYNYIVTYDAYNGTPYANGTFDEVVDQMVNSGSGTVISSTENIINEFRCRIAEGDIDCKEVLFVYNNEQFEANKYGKFSQWPLGFCDTWDNHLDRLLKIDE